MGSRIERGVASPPNLERSFLGSDLTDVGSTEASCLFFSTFWPQKARSVIIPFQQFLEGGDLRLTSPSCASMS
jgi:hypothetical protein